MPDGFKDFMEELYSGYGLKPWVGLFLFILFGAVVLLLYALLGRALLNAIA